MQNRFRRHIDITFNYRLNQKQRKAEERVNMQNFA